MKTISLQYLINMPANNFNAGIEGWFNLEYLEKQQK